MSGRVRLNNYTFKKRKSGQWVDHDEKGCVLKKSIEKARKRAKCSMTVPKLTGTHKQSLEGKRY